MGNYEMKFKGNAWNLIMADITMVAQYVPILFDAKFYVKVDVDLDGLDEVRIHSYLVQWFPCESA